MRKSAFRFVLESAVRRTLRSVEEDGAVVVVDEDDWMEVEEGLALDAFKVARLTFGGVSAPVVVGECE